MLTLVTVIYGDDRRYRVELFGSVLSALKLRENDATRIVVYTDRPLDGFPLPITERIISTTEWQEWTRGSGITHLVKLHLVRQTLEQGSGPVIYFDTDTLFLTAPEQLAARLSPGTALMHAAEGPIRKHEIWEPITAWLGTGREVCGQQLSGDTVMFNSGIVGVVAEHAEALRRSIDIADALYAVDPVFSLDQFSTGAALMHQAQVSGCEQDVLHYWGWNRSFIRDSIDAFWQQHEGESVATMCGNFNPADYARMPAMHWRDKLAARYLELRHRLNDDGRFACIALRSAQRHATADSDTANRWFTVHLDFLRKQQAADPGQGNRLIQALATDHENCRAWLCDDNLASLIQLTD